MRDAEVPNQDPGSQPINAGSNIARNISLDGTVERSTIIGGDRNIYVDELVINHGPLSGLGRAIRKNLARRALRPKGALSRWYLRVGALVVFAIAGSGVGWHYFRKPARVIPPPDHYTKSWHETFDSDRLNQDLWHSTGDGWQIAKSPGNQGYLTTGSGWLVRNDLEATAIYDFNVEFPLRFIDGATKASWVFRGQEDHRSGYIFELERRDNDLYLTGHLVADGKIKVLDSTKLGIEGPFYEPDIFTIEAEVTSHKFHYSIKLQSTQVRNADGSARSWIGNRVAIVDIFDHLPCRFSFGNIGLIGEGNSNRVGYDYIAFETGINYPAS